MPYYPFLGQAYCINGVHYDIYGDIEDEQPHSESEDEEDSRDSNKGENIAEEND